jgi:spermidine synthase
VHDDIVNVLSANVAGFDAIMLDTDNGPDGMLMSESARLYAMFGIETTVAALRPGGTIAYWSVGEDPKFLDALRRSRLTVQTLRVRAHDTAGPTHILYVATRRARR